MQARGDVCNLRIHGIFYDPVAPMPPHSICTAQRHTRPGRIACGWQPLSKRFCMSFADCFIRVGRQLSPGIVPKKHPAIILQFNPDLR